MLCLNWHSNMLCKQDSNNCFFNYLRLVNPAKLFQTKLPFSSGCLESPNYNLVRYMCLVLVELSLNLANSIPTEMHWTITEAGYHSNVVPKLAFEYAVQAGLEVPKSYKVNYFGNHTLYVRVCKYCNSYGTKYDNKMPSSLFSSPFGLTALTLHPSFMMGCVSSFRIWDQEYFPEPNLIL